ncbi:MAG: KH domain-containing protein [bacterium]|nr:KH domain-containing protein [bacterium]
MKELVEYIVKALVDKPEDVRVNEVKSEKTVILELKVDQQDIGKVIGKQGRIIKAIRVVINAAAAKSMTRVVLEILD